MQLKKCNKNALLT